MSLLNDCEKVAFLIDILNRHIQKLPCGDTFRIPHDLTAITINEK
jgi:hypothetical protein